jgi:ATP-dependent HslUV protease ATP-binding subunit HslU
MKIKNLTPIKIVQQLDKYIIGQSNAKKSVAIAMRNRWRRLQISGELQKEITPNNIILIGPTGVGKTEIARRLSQISNSPFVKVEASKFTEVGYVGRDVESMVRELLDVAINQLKSKMTEEVKSKALENAKERVLDILIPLPKIDAEEIESEQTKERYFRTREKFTKMLDEGKLNDREIEVSVTDKQPQFELLTNIGIENIDLNIGEMISGILPGKRKKKNNKMKIPDALKYFIKEESERLVSKDKVITEAKKLVEENGIIFIDEIDKIAASGPKQHNDVSRSGVQRDLLPIVEGSNVPTKYGIVNTSHILFISAGAFSVSKPSDLIPELQGRFPIRVELNSLQKDDFIKILKYPKNSLIKQYMALFSTENVNLTFDDNAISLIAEFAETANEKMEDIGARRLHTIMNTLLQDYLFELPESKLKEININENEVRDKLSTLIEDEDLSKYIL